MFLFFVCFVFLYLYGFFQVAVCEKASLLKVLSFLFSRCSVLIWIWSTLIYACMYITLRCLFSSLTMSYISGWIFLLLCGRCWDAWVKFLCILWKFTFVTFVKNFLYGNENFSLYFTYVHSFVTCPLLWLKYHIKYTKNWKSIRTVRGILFHLYYIDIFLIFCISKLTAFHVKDTLLIFLR